MLPAVFYPTLVALGFVFRNAHSDQSANQSACRRTHAHTGVSQRPHDGTCGYERSQTWNRERADAGQQPEGAADRRRRPWLR